MSLFGKKLDSGTVTSQLPSTTRVDEIVAALIASNNDSSALVQKAISRALYDIGRKQANLVVSANCDYFQKNARLEKAHRILLLNVLNNVIDLRRDELAADVALRVVTLALAEMTADKEVVADWQQAASSVLVSLGVRFPDEILSELLKRFAPGAVPHYFIITTLGDFVSNNALAVVPRLKEVLARVLPVLGLVRADPMRAAFAQGLGQFAEAITHYVANIGTAAAAAETSAAASASGGLTTASFASDVYPAYEILVSNWLQSKEAKVRLGTVLAVGCIAPVLAPEQLVAQLPKLVPLVLGMYKKEKELLPITQGLCLVLAGAMKVAPEALEPLLPSCLTTLHATLCETPDAAQLGSAKNFNESLRCVQTIGAGYSDTLVTFLLERIHHKELKIKVGTLGIIRHLITHLATPLEDKKGLLVSGIKALTGAERNEVLRVKLELSQIIIGMAAHGYLALEGGEALVEFVIRNAAIADDDVERWQAAQAKAKEKDRDAVSPFELRTISENILNLATTTIDQMQPVLWPLLLEFVVPVQYTPAFNMLAKCVGHLAGIKRASGARDYMIDFDRAVNLPKPPAIIARFLVMLCAPHGRTSGWLHMLTCLRQLGPLLHPSICDMWDAALPKLQAYLEARKDDESQLDQSVWDELILRLLSETIKVANDDDWLVQLGEALYAQLLQYQQLPALRRVAFKQLGLVLQKATHKEFLRTKLTGMLSTVKHTDPAERTGCAQGLGYCGTTHLDMTLEALAAPPRPQAGAKSSGSGSGGLLGGLFGGSKDKSSSSSSSSSSSGSSSGSDKDGMALTVMLAYGYVCTYAQPALITSRIDISIMNHLKPQLVKLRSPLAKEVMMQTIELIAAAMHPEALQKEYVFKHRDDLLRQVLQYIVPQGKDAKPHEVTGSMRLLGLRACTTLAALDPPLPDDLLRTLLERVVTYYALPPAPSSGPASPAAKAPKGSGAKAAQDDDDPSATYEAIHTLLAMLLFKQPTVDCLICIFQSLENWAVSREAVHRERSIVSLCFVLRKFIEIRKSAPAGAAPSTAAAATADGSSGSGEAAAAGGFTEAGHCLALLIPRCTDPVLVVRRTSIQAIQLCLYIDMLLRDPNADPSLPLLTVFNDYRERIGTDELNEQFSCIHEMSRALAKLVTVGELPELLLSLLKGLTDHQLPSTSGTCVVLNGLIKARGKELLVKLPALVSGLLQAMPTIANEQTLNGTLHAVRSLAGHHQLPVVDLLLGQPMPHTKFVVLSFQALCKDKQHVMGVVSYLVDIINTQVSTEERLDPKKKANALFALPLPMAATCALGEMLETDELEDIVAEHYPMLLSSLLLRVGTANGTADDIASKQITATLRQFLDAAQDAMVQAAMTRDDNWNRLSKPNYDATIIQIASAVAKSHSKEMPAIFNQLLPYVKGNFVPQRIVAMTVIAEFVNHCRGDPALLGQLVNCLLGSLVDPVVKLQALRGLGNIVAVGAELANKYAPTVLDALLTSIDDRLEPLAREAMAGLAKLFEIVEEARMAPVIVNLCHRIRPAFEKDNDDIRAAAYTLFGSLWRFGSGSAQEAFYEQVHTYLPSLVLHCNDVSAQVIVACKQALRQLVPLLHSQPLQEVVDAPQLDAHRSLDYGEFLNDISMAMIESFPERMNSYVMTCCDFFKSEWNLIRANACSFNGIRLLLRCLLLAHLMMTHAACLPAANACCCC
eukprot:TRINITY_DN3745_c0_g1_i3.p1 TRINITY_DN3745_c0_g1~~TRINITY_DN3745_c0_g1_i3.p1  ORF type:complete len:1692 (-),score=828.04 TRINITY_DN3745_c0_g1_i3:272-5347(-)